MFYLIPADDMPRSFKASGETILTDSDISTIENALSNLAAQCDKDAAELDKEGHHCHLAAMLRESAAKYRATLTKIQGGE